VLAAGALIRRWIRGSGRRALLQFRARVDRFKLVDRRTSRADLLADPEVRLAIERCAAEKGLKLAAVEAEARAYAAEIVPAFSVFSYYKVAYRLAGMVARAFYRVSVVGREHLSAARTSRNDALVYLMNHRSNIDSAVLTYVLAGDVSISYAVGEWARTWPLERLFKSFGAYFVRRRYPEPLYHTVLERYVHLITRNRVTQGLYPEGGLTRDGTIRPPKIGLLDYIVGALRDPGFDGEIWIVPVSINYDRVLEDRTLVRELVVGASPLSRWDQLRGVLAFLWGNLGWVLGGHRLRVGRAAIRLGRPVGVRAWLDREAPGALTADRTVRRAAIDRLAREVMRTIADGLPVTPIPLAAAALLSFQESVITEGALAERMEALRRSVARAMDPPDLRVDELLARAWRTFRARRWVVLEGDHLVIMPSARPIIEYYANSIRHLLPSTARWALSPAIDDDPSLPRLATPPLG